MASSDAGQSVVAPARTGQAPAVLVSLLHQQATGLQRGDCSQSTISETVTQCAPDEVS